MNQKKNQKICSLTFQTVDENNFRLLYPEYTEKILKRDNHRLSLETIKLIFKSKKFSSKQKVLALILLRDLCRKGNYQFLIQVDEIFTNRICEMLMSVQNGKWQKTCQILFKYSNDKNLKWGMRFYLLLTELLRELGTNILPVEPTGEDSRFKKIWDKLSNEILTTDRNYYYDYQIENFPQQDEEFLKHFQISQQKSQVSTLREKHKKEFQGFEKIKQNRKKYLNLIFGEKIEQKEYAFIRSEYERVVEEEYEGLEQMLRTERENFEMTKIFKELQLSVKIFEIEKQNGKIDSDNVQKKKELIKNLIQDIYGKVPKIYTKNFDQKPKIENQIEKTPGFEITVSQEQQVIDSNSKIRKYKYEEVKEVKKDLSLDFKQVEEVSEKPIIYEKRNDKKLLLLEYKAKEEKYEELKKEFDTLKRKYWQKCNNRILMAPQSKLEVETELARIQLQNKMRKELRNFNQLHSQQRQNQIINGKLILLTTQRVFKETQITRQSRLSRFIVLKLLRQVQEDFPILRSSRVRFNLAYDEVFLSQSLSF